MKKILPMMPIFAVVVSILVALPNIIQFFHKDTIKLNIQKKSEVQLAAPLGVDGLVSQYIYNDSIKVDNLWQTTFKIEHIGNKAIYSNEFNDTALVDNCIPLTIKHDDGLLAVRIINQNIDANILDMNRLIIKQWRPDEFVEILILSANEESPQLSISDRCIKDAEISYSEFDPKNSIRQEFIGLVCYIISLVIISVFGLFLFFEIIIKNEKIKKICYAGYFLYVMGMIVCHMVSIYKSI